MGLSESDLRPGEDVDADMQGSAVAGLDSGMQGSNSGMQSVVSGSVVDVVGSGTGYVVDDIVEGSMQIDGDLGESTFDVGMRVASGSESEVYSASVVSFNEGLPQGEPSFQRQDHDDVEALVASLDRLTMGHSAAASGQLRLSFEGPSGSSNMY